MAEQLPRRKQRRRWRKICFVAGFVVCFIAMAPALCNWGPIRGWLLRLASHDLPGTLSARAIRLSWWRPWRIEGLTLTATDGDAVANIPNCRGSRSLCGWFTSGGDLGDCHFDEPTLNLRVQDGRINLADALVKKKQDSAAVSGGDLKKFLKRHFTWQVHVHDGRVRYQSDNNVAPWTAGDLNVSLGIHRTGGPGNQRVLTMQPGRLIERMQISPRITEDLLQYIAPLLAQATRIEGSFSLGTDGAVLPADDPANGYCRGVLTIHRVELSPGPLLRELSRQLALAPALRLVDECEIPFVLHDRSVTHRDLAFQLGDVTLDSRGTVAFDKTIDLDIGLQLPEKGWQPRGPLVRHLSNSLQGRRISLPFRGSLEKPRLDMAQLAEQAMTEGSLWQDLVEGAPEALGELGRELQKRRDERLKAGLPRHRPLQRLRQLLEGSEIGDNPEDADRHAADETP